MNHYDTQNHIHVLFTDDLIDYLVQFACLIYFAYFHLISLVYEAYSLFHFLTHMYIYTCTPVCIHMGEY
jgi:hypothetical protein